MPIRPMAGTVALIAAIAATPASAATVELETAPWGDQTLRYTAAPGEENRLSLSHAVSGLPAPLASGEGTLTFTVADPEAPLTAGTGCVQVGSHEVTCEAADTGGVLDLIVLLGDRDDRADVSTGAYAFGNVDLGAGDDRLNASSGSAVLSIHGGAGADRIDMRDHDALPDDPVFPNGLPLNEILGGDGDDRIAGANAVDWISGGEGDDRISGGANEDRLDGGDGDDRLDSHDGVADEPVTCGAGFDRASADASDSVHGDCEDVSRSTLPPLL